jgi:hypothetical protein
VAAVRGALLLLAAVAACGDPLADDRYRGEPLAHLQGDVAPRPEQDDFINLRLALFWMADGPYAGDVERFVEDAAASTDLPAPGPFVLNVFDPPDSARLVREAGYGVARLLVYRDRNHDGRRDPGEPFLGSVGPEALLFAGRALPAESSPSRRALPAGFHQVMLPLLCNERPPAAMDPGDCGVPLGAACETDGDCGHGVCVKRLPAPVVNGACVLPAGAASGCRPAQAAYLPTRWLRGFEGVYLKACHQDGECLRASDLGKDLYRCDVALGGCVPRLGLHVDVRPDYPLAPVCGDAPAPPPPGM